GALDIEHMFEYRGEYFPTSHTAEGLFGEDPMSALRSGIDELAGEDLASRTHAEITDDVAEISRAIDRLQYELSRRVEESRRRGEYSADGFLSVNRWLATTTNLDHATAQRIV